MARYIKANPKVADFLGLKRDRNTVTDGNYLLWQADILPFGPLTQLPEILTQIGGIALLPHEAREEQDGTVTRPLPVATDPRFVIEAREQENAPTNEDNIEQVAKSQQEGEGAAEGSAESDSGESGAESQSEETNDDNE